MNWPQGSFKVNASRSNFSDRGSEAGTEGGGMRKEITADVNTTSPHQLLRIKTNAPIKQEIMTPKAAQVKMKKKKRMSATQF